MQTAHVRAARKERRSSQMKELKTFLYSGPALSLPSMIVIGRTLGLKKTAVYVSLVVVMATISGMAFGAVVA